MTLHGLSPGVQLTTTVIGQETDSPTGVLMRKRWPFAATTVD